MRSTLNVYDRHNSLYYFSKKNFLSDFFILWDFSRRSKTRGPKCSSDPFEEHLFFFIKLLSRRIFRSKLRVLTPHTYILVCGKPRFLGTPKIWIYTRSITCIMAIQRLDSQVSKGNSLQKRREVLLLRVAFSNLCGG